MGTKTTGQDLGANRITARRKGGTKSEGNRHWLKDRIGKEEHRKQERSRWKEGDERHQLRRKESGGI